MFKELKKSKTEVANLKECLMKLCQIHFVQKNLGHLVSEMVTVQGKEIQGDS